MPGAATAGARGGVELLQVLLHAHVVPLQAGPVDAHLAGVVYQLVEQFGQYANPLALAGLLLFRPQRGRALAVAATANLRGIREGDDPVAFSGTLGFTEQLGVGEHL